MTGRVIRFLTGYICIYMDSPQPERFFNLCAFRRITLWGLVPRKNGYLFSISRQDYTEIEEIAQKTGTELSLTGQYGIPFLAQKYRSRKPFVLSFFFCMTFIYVLTLFIWQIQVSGLTVRNPEEVLTFLKEQHVQYGIRKTTVDCDAIEVDLRSEFTDFVWVSVSVKGTCLNIQIKENVDSYEDAEKLPETGDITSDMSGTVVSIITRAGTPQVSVGDTVEEGQILISGREERLNDNGDVTGYMECCADGDVTIQTVISYEDSFSYVHEAKAYKKKKKYRLTLQLFQKVWTVFNQTPKSDAYESTTVIQTLSVGKSFYLPVVYELETFRIYEEVEAVYTKKEAEEAANANFNAFMENLEKKGVEIIENSVKIVLRENLCVTSGELTVNSPAGVLTELSTGDAAADVTDAQAEEKSGQTGSESEQGSG